ncbi:hypothetical protein E2320_006709 [Naja naja]|nr:hypothetical protein E2320_006709 [Naja naja]
MKPNSHTLQNSAPGQRVHRFIVPGNCENCNLSTSGGYQMVEDCLNTNQTAIKRKENIQAGKEGGRKGCRERNGGSEGGEEREREGREREISYPQGNKMAASGGITRNVSLDPSRLTPRKWGEKREQKSKNLMDG